LPRLNITLREDLLAELSRVVGHRKRSRFIQEAVARSLRELREKRLAHEYREASAGMRRINKQLEGALGDGLD
jgi:metal-responsive CopG/Arc/MetJ family transcriptional regulator